MKRREALKLGGSALTMPLVAGCLDFDGDGPSGEMSGYADWISAEGYDDTTVLAVGLDRTSALAEELGGADAGIDAEGVIVQFAVGSPLVMLVSTETNSGGLLNLLSGASQSGDSISISNVYAINSELIVYAGSFGVEDVAQQLLDRGYSEVSTPEPGSSSNYKFYRFREDGAVVGLGSDALVVSSGEDAMTLVGQATDVKSGGVDSLASRAEAFSTLASMLSNRSMNATLFLDRPRGIQEMFSIQMEPTGTVIGMSSNAGLVENDLEASLAVLYSGEDDVDSRSALESMASGADEVTVRLDGRSAVVEAFYESVV